jgi:hypothetical protein
MTVRRSEMDARSYSRLAAVVFAVIALLQLVRALSGWQVVLNDTPIPLWPSWFAFAFALVLAWLGFAAARSTVR